MAFLSNDIIDYLEVLDNPKYGINMLHTVRDTNEKYDKYNKDIIFQIIDMYSYHTDDETKKFNIMLFGKTKEDLSVCVNIEGYQPYFYIEIEPNWKTFTCDRIINDVKRKVRRDAKDSLINYEIISAHKFYGFTNNEKFKFLKLIFNNYDGMRSYAKSFTMNHSMPYISRQRKVNFKLFESNINPIIRFLHVKNIDPIGWCSISKDKFKDFADGQQQGNTKININCNWKDINRYECTDIHKFTILSFDIECISEDGKFPNNRDGDNIIQIGMTYSYLGDPECYKQIILCLKNTSPVENAIVKCYNTEEELMLAFTNEIHIHDPDIITGYNIFGFDIDYMKNRAKKLGVYTQFSRLSRIKGFVCNYIDQKLESGAMGVNNLKYYNTPGRVCVDLMKYIQREYKLNGYSLDNVAANFIRDKIELAENISIDKKQYTKLKVKSTAGIRKQDYITVFYNDGSTDTKIGYKHKIYDLGEKYIIIPGQIDISQYLQNKWKIFWCQAKDDVGPHEIFKLYRKGSDEKSIIAKYCIKDCNLCNRLMAKLQVLPNSIGMGNVCCVPLSYLFLKGQGIKIFSLVSKQCREENHIIPTMVKKFKPLLDKNGMPIQTEEQINKNKFQQFARFLVTRNNNNNNDSDSDDDEGKYEGATVYDPVKGVHYDPVIVGDYSSLYPSSMIMKNVSHNSIVLDEKYDNLEGYKYHEQTYNKSDGTTKTCKFAEPIGDDPLVTKAIIPRILMKLLSTRKKCNALKESEKDPFKKAVWDGLQLAYKITANSLYGQCGSSVSAISMKDLAACTTSIGRDMLDLAKYFVENIMLDIINLIKETYETNNDNKYLKYMRKYYVNVSSKKLNDKEEYYMRIKKEIYDLIGEYDIDPKCIYGDTDSVFFKLNMTDKNKNPVNDHKALAISIKIGIIVTGILNNTLDYPQGLAYEKVYWPFIIISKKRYVGNLYSTDPNEFYQKSMGLVMKRRDNADVVKDVVGGIIDQMLNKRSKIGAINFTREKLLAIITGKYDIEKFIISKTLKDKEMYKNWISQVHVVLADRMTQRDPGNKPQSNDRIPFIYIETDKKVKLQGERVEHPQFIKDNKLKIDYSFYITNQIMKPAIQFLELIAKNPEKIFNNFLIREENRRSGIEPIMKYFKNCKGNENDCDINITVGGKILELKYVEKKRRKRLV